MGYSTNFWGTFTIDKEVDEDTFKLLEGLQQTRRMKRDPIKLAMRLGISTKEVKKLYGTDCEFWVGDTDDAGQNHTKDIVDYNKPPSTQPSLWCQWQIQDDYKTIRWDGGEKFYEYIDWIRYLVVTILAPRGYVVNGEMDWQGEESDDRGQIEVLNNKIIVKEACTFFLAPEDSKRVRKIVNDYLNNPLKEVIDTKLDTKK